MSDLYCSRINTPKGVFLFLFSDMGIYEIYFPGSAPEKNYPERPLPCPELEEDLKRYLQGEFIDWSKYPLDCSGYPPFIAAVLEEVRQIPFGEVITYRQAAEKAGSPLAWRAAGQALKTNRHPVIVPCHRVVGSSGKLGGFSGPPGWKKMLLDLEGVIEI
ncbi:MAG: methylated-DNA--[protein]-cysteine S-methyltransferase [Dethiobacteria bacterium]